MVVNPVGVQMIYQRLENLFARYCAAHLVVAGRPLPLVGEDGETLGYIDHISRHGSRLVLQGWADCGQVVVSQAGKRHRRSPDQPRFDVGHAFPDLANQTPGFTIDLPLGQGPLSLTLLRGANRLIFPVPLPGSRARRMAQLQLLVPFMRDLCRGTPAILRWLVTGNPANRAQLKRALRLDAAPKPRQMQPLLFLADSLAHLPADRQSAECVRLQAASLSHRAITIIMPIYNALALLSDALTRVVQNTDLPWRLILIEDASSDPAVRPFLRAWANSQPSQHRDRITLIEHTENQGFIGSVNAGLTRAISLGDHVVLLNSDAFVPQAWASRLMRPFLEHDRVASVTPMSNDAEIFSAPVICRPSALVPGEGDAIDALAHKIHPDAGLADAPTGVGFCMAMSIDYLRRIPRLDPGFGRGYGEEVDWCQKTRALGGRHLGLANLFVEHRGGTSFGSAEKQRLIARNGAEISRRYPQYDADVQAFIADDPLAASRLALAIGWAAGRAEAPVPLYIAHNMGGGAEDYLANRIARSLPEAALVLRVGTATAWQLELHSAQGVTRGGTDDFALIQRLLDPVKSLRITYSCGVGAQDPVGLPVRILALQRGPQDQIELLFHDYFPISPSYTLLNSAGRFTGLPDPDTLDVAHRAHRADGRPLALRDWQAAWGAVVAKSDCVTVFSRSSADLVLAAYPAARSKLCHAPHQPLVDLPRIVHGHPGRHPVIGVLGNIGHHKGAGVLQDLSHRLDRIGTARLVLLGQLDPAYRLAASASVLGGYLRPDIPALTARYGITDWLIPSIWPESFSYTTQEAIATGLPVWSFDLGAQADAIRKHGLGGTIAIPDGRPDLDALLAALLPSDQHSGSAAA